MTARSDIEQQVEFRADSRCEYCRMHQSLQGATFHVEHVIPRSHGGQTVLENLAWACPGCNLRKSDRVLVEDPQTGRSVSLFSPRASAWNDHFRWNGYEIAGITATGRATLHALDLNNPRRLRIRHAEELFGLFPVE